MEYHFEKDMHTTVIPLTSKPPILQIDARECGLVALANIFQHYGKKVSISQLRSAANNIGVRKASGLIHAAKQYGLRAKSSQCDIQTLVENPYLWPAIVLWNNHRFVVLDKVLQNRFILQDPQTGMKELSKESFSKHFSKIAIFFTPTKEFTTTGITGHLSENSLEAVLQNGIEGEVSSLQNHTDRFAHDFGGMVSKQARIVVQAICENDVIHCLKVAQHQEIPVTIRGAGHSCQGQSLSDKGILLINGADHAEFELLDNNRVSVTTRSRWNYLEHELNQIGLTFPILTDNLATTIGGTLSVGGYGPRSIVGGAQIFHVEKARVIRPNGTAVWCSKTKHPELFQFSLASLGQVGFLERVVLNTIPIVSKTNWYQSQTKTVSTLAHQLKELATSKFLPDAFMAYQIMGEPLYAFFGFDQRINAISNNPLEEELKNTNATLVESPMNLGPIYRQNEDVGTYCPAVDYLVEPDDLLDFLEFINKKIAENALEAYIKGLLILGVKQIPNNLKFPFEASAFGNSPIKYLVGFYPMISKKDLNGLTKVQKMLKETLTFCLTLGGRPYLYGWHELDQQTKHIIYSPHYAHLQQLRQQLDPKQLFNSGTF